MSFKYGFLTVLLMAHMAPGHASMLDGIYRGPGTWPVRLAEQDSSKCTISHEDITQGCENCSTDKLSISLLSDFVDILVPRKLEVKVQEEYMGSAVTVNERLPVVEFGNTRFNDVYRLTVETSGVVIVEGSPIKRSKRKTFEILYSAGDGLIAFRQLPGKREDFFLIDWRSLEERRKNNRE